MNLVLANLGALAFQLIFPPFLFILGLTLVLASLGKSLGIRRLYVRFLVQVFEFARKITVEHHQRRNSRHKLNDDSEDEEDRGSFRHVDDDGKLDKNETEKKPTPDVATLRSYMKKYGKESRHNVISRKDNLILVPDKPSTVLEEDPASQTNGNGETAQNGIDEADVSPTKEVGPETEKFELHDVFDYVKTGIGSIIEDEVTQRFVAEELKSWNLLTRTSLSFEFVNVKLTVIWILGFFVRYFVLLPGRTLILIVGLMWMAACMTFVGQLPDGDFKKTLHHLVYTSCFQILGGALSAVITYHDPQNRPKTGICVANHTSPIDVLVLACDNAYALIGQRHSGFMGRFQKILSKCAGHIWFERSESKDRALITKRLKEHVDDPNKLPILIFPEGTCINNTSVMQFKKGSFEVGGTIYPVAIKYDPKFGDAFWNSSENGMLSYIYMMMTSWAIVCDVWYLPPMTRSENEDAIQFANRVKAEIARQGGLVDLMWDGNLKRMQVKTEWKARQQEEFSRRLKVD